MGITHDGAWRASATPGTPASVDAFPHAALPESHQGDPAAAHSGEKDGTSRESWKAGSSMRDAPEEMPQNVASDRIKTASHRWPRGCQTRVTSLRGRSGGNAGSKDKGILEPPGDR